MQYLTARWTPGTDKQPPEGISARAKNKEDAPVSTARQVGFDQFMRRIGTNSTEIYMCLITMLNILLDNGLKESSRQGRRSRKKSGEPPEGPGNRRMQQGSRRRVADPKPASISDYSEDFERPGMCIDEYFRKHPEEMEIFVTRLTETSGETSDPNGSTGGHSYQETDWSLEQMRNDFPLLQKSSLCHLLGFSELRNCSLDRDCGYFQKCCWTVCGMRCVLPIFEVELVDEPDYQLLDMSLSPDEEDLQEFEFLDVTEIPLQEGEPMARQKQLISGNGEDGNEEEAS
ncbi:uncharacterized protein LOC144767796 [Lissotriton helveticus]